MSGTRGRHEKDSSYRPLKAGQDADLTSCNLELENLLEKRTGFLYESWR